jgi:hypothetical protein
LTAAAWRLNGERNLEVGVIIGVIGVDEAVVNV